MSVAMTTLPTTKKTNSSAKLPNYLLNTLVLGSYAHYD